MKKIGFVTIFLFLIIGISLIALVSWWKTNTSALSADKSTQRIVIPKGESAEEIGNILFEKNIIRNPLAFKLYVQFFGKQTSINAGEFKLSPSMSLDEILETLGKGPEELWVTIPEGLRREEIVEIVIKDLEMDSDYANDFRSEFLNLTSTMEGYLFPDTYLFARDVTANQVMTAMKNNFDKRFTDKMREDMEKKGLTLSKTVILASILEKETKTDAERPTVAGIYFNRINSGIALYVDATAQYAIGTNKCKGVLGECDWWKPPTREDLEIDSKYNTYKYAGLPPTAISNPGLSSLRAIIYSEDNPYFYYLHDSSGTIHYGVSLEDHNANVNKYLR